MDTRRYEVAFIPWARPFICHQFVQVYPDDPTPAYNHAVNRRNCERVNDWNRRAAIRFGLSRFPVWTYSSLLERATCHEDAGLA